MRPAGSLCHSFRLPCNVFNVPYLWRISATQYDTLQTDYGFPIYVLFIVSPTLPTHQNLPVRLQRGPTIWFSVPCSAEHVYQHACKSCSELPGLGRVRRELFPTSSGAPAHPPAVLASPLVQSRSVAKPGRPLPAPVQRSKVPTCTAYRAASLVAPPPPLALSPGLR